ncbi:hypothetical protein GCK72_003074 [Caenorhabditis remanei]|uniref:Protein kinase domain-containing protein n=1 Tax=Caenorhabditis remanei TaxID=31234 RepID=A0A6A5HTI0_CAERE|nr:hypothetical protein GCK72_003074 [Caenorhabditis remanei]KAF1771248.1 hypothetical protein GCK72_003074 [Caenorhabditis remanei]
MDDDDFDRVERQTEEIEISIGEEVRDSKKSGKIWRVEEKLGEGGFGSVYRVTGKDDKREAAMKIQKGNLDPSFVFEREVMIRMQKESTAPKLYDDGNYKSFSFIVMSLLGSDLEKIYEKMDRNLSKSTVLMISVRTLSAVKQLHEIGFLHRDLKPSNFAVDVRPNCGNICLLDYGLARCYAKKDEKGGWWIRRPRDRVTFRGNLRYCSIKMHRNLETGRNEDLENRPNYENIFCTLCEILKESKGTMNGEIEYEKFRIAATKGNTIDRKVCGSKKESNEKILEDLKQEFRKVVIPGGYQHVLPNSIDFYGLLRNKEIRKVVDNENGEKKHEKDGENGKNEARLKLKKKKGGGAKGNY